MVDSTRFIFCIPTNLGYNYLDGRYPIFFLWIFFGGPEQFQLKEGTWVKEVRQENGMTTIIITDGKEEVVGF